VVITASTMVEVSGCSAVQSQSCGPIDGLRGPRASLGTLVHEMTDESYFGVAAMVRSWVRSSLVA
jgi:hypothetical protein